MLRHKMKPFVTLYLVITVVFIGSMTQMAETRKAEVLQKAFVAENETQIAASHQVVP